MFGTGNVDKKRHDGGEGRGRHANSKHNNNWCEKSQGPAILHNPRNRFLSSSLFSEARAPVAVVPANAVLQLRSDANICYRDNTQRNDVKSQDNRGLVHLAGQLVGPQWFADHYSDFRYGLQLHDEEQWHYHNNEREKPYKKQYAFDCLYVHLRLHAVHQHSVAVECNGRDAADSHPVEDVCEREDSFANELTKRPRDREFFADMDRIVNE